MSGAPRSSDAAAMRGVLSDRRSARGRSTPQLQELGDVGSHFSVGVEIIDLASRSTSE